MTIMDWLPTFGYDEILLGGLATLLVLIAGLMSGLTLGLMSLDHVDMELLKRTGTEREKRLAASIAPIISNQHYLLVTLLLINAVAMEALPLVLDTLADPVTAVITSVTVVLLFGEIVPQAVCSRYGLEVGAHSSWLVRALMLLVAPVAWPMGKLLDLMLGKDHRVLFRRTQLKELVSLHNEMGSMLTEDEVKVICGALDLTSKTARQAMTPLHKAFMLSADAVLDRPTLLAIVRSGHSRIPVHRGSDREAILGLLLVKELVRYRRRGAVPVADIMMRSLPRFPAATPLYDLLNLFQTGRTHMVVLTEQRSSSTDAGAPEDGGEAAEGAAAAAAGEAAEEGGGLLPTFSGPVAFPSWGEHALQDARPVGILTIEDVIEELMQVEIIDETDRYVDNEQRIKVDAAQLLGGLPPALQAVLAQRSVFHQQQLARHAAAGQYQPPSLLDTTSPFYSRGGSRATTGGRGGAAPKTVHRQTTAPATSLMRQVAASRLLEQQQGLTQEQQQQQEQDREQQQQQQQQQQGASLLARHTSVPLPQQASSSSSRSRGTGPPGPSGAAPLAQHWSS